jgi:hypothetical protein
MRHFGSCTERESVRAVLTFLGHFCNLYTTEPPPYADGIIQAVLVTLGSAYNRSLARLVASVILPMCMYGSTIASMLYSPVYRVSCVCVCVCVCIVSVVSRFADQLEPAVVNGIAAIESSNIEFDADARRRTCAILLQYVAR